MTGVWNSPDESGVELSCAVWPEQVTKFLLASAYSTAEDTNSLHPPPKGWGWRETGRRRARPVPGMSEDLAGELPSRLRKGQEAVRERDLRASWGKQDEGKTLVPLSALGPAASGLQAETTGAYSKGAFVRYRPIQSHVTAQVTKSDTKKGRVHGRAGTVWPYRRTDLGKDTPPPVKAAAPEPGCWAATSVCHGGASTSSTCAEDTGLR